MRAAALCLALLPIAGCVSTAPEEGEFLTFDIAAETQPCTGVAPMRCLIVNGEYFYDPIAGYTHVEGRPATITVLRTPAPIPVPADASAYTYTRVDG
ncbi:hypothetical protein PSA7680_00996 [Pseudoruegeria aquimaris]|uniref:DUF4377 domain-containing protein n=1 Tax=Pseudoruegeria aquimaris TaxID=393663 RepID=A0A1Y5RWF5_9RHOB|nr:DUF4377 domain-containing protein [Pseudoruegeria aquimaris]SLN24169.1 hypothetical protein PSA7680_00996 [Pseudoruegeria aquimaris]